MATIAALGSASLMFLIGSLLLVYAIVNQFYLKRENTMSVYKSAGFCYLWSAGLVISWVIFLFV